jgi:hypothetical protein
MKPSVTLSPQRIGDLIVRPMLSPTAEPFAPPTQATLLDRYSVCRISGDLGSKWEMTPLRVDFNSLQDALAWASSETLEVQAPVTQHLRQSVPAGSIYVRLLSDYPPA